MGGPNVVGHMSVGCTTSVDAQFSINGLSSPRVANNKDFLVAEVVFEASAQVQCRGRLEREVLLPMPVWKVQDVSNGQNTRTMSKSIRFLLIVSFFVGIFFYYFVLFIKMHNSYFVFLKKL